MSDRPPETGFVDAVDNDCGKEETWNLDAADHTVHRGGRRVLRGPGGLRSRRVPADRVLVTQEAIQIRALAPLEDPGVRHSEPAISQK
jgi:hypothetical protein